MKAIVYRRYGSPDVLALEDIAKPVPGDGDVLVRVRAAAVNPLDWHLLRGIALHRSRDVRLVEAEAKHRRASMLPESSRQSAAT